MEWHITQERYVRFVKGLALILICMSDIVQATAYTVTSTADDGTVGTLRQRIGLADSTFLDFNVPDSSTILLGSTINIGHNITIDATQDTSNNLQIQNPITGTIFDTNSILILFGKAVTGNVVTWGGGISTTNLLEFHQSATGTYAFGISGIGGNVEYSININQTLTLTGTSTYTGGTTITGGAGTVLVGATNALPTTGTVTLDNGTALTIGGGFSQTVGGLANGLVGTGTLNLNGTGFTLNSNADNSFAGLITGTSPFTKLGTGTLTLTNANTDTGLMTINNGALRLSTGGRWNGNVSLVGVPTATLVMNGGTVTGTITGDGTANSILSITGAFTPTVANNITNMGLISIANGGTLSLISNFVTAVNSTLTNAGTFTMGGFNLAMGSGSTFNSNSNFAPTGVISANAGTYTFNVGNNSTLTVNNPITGYNLLSIAAGSTVLLTNNLVNPAGSTITNAGTFTMGGFNLSMGNGSTFNSNSNFTTTGSILASAGNYTFNVGGGTLTVNSPISGYSNLNVNGGSTVVLNSAGSLSNGITLTGSTFTINGGTFSGNIVNGGGASILNVNTAFTAPGTVAVNTLNINNGGTFTPGSAVTVASILNVNAGGTLALTNNIGGSVNNAGTITHATNAVRTINGNFTQSGTLNILVESPLSYSQFNVTGNTILNGGAIQLNFAESNTVNFDGGEVLNVITSTGPMTANALPTVPSVSRFLAFRPRVSGNIFQLVAERVPLEIANTIPALDGIAAGLDGVVGDPDFDSVFNFIDQTTTQTEFEQLLEQLAPTGLNNLYVPTMGEASVLLRLDAMRNGNGMSLVQGKTGYSAGDMLEDQGSFGPIVFGNSTKQSSRGGLSGYNAFTGGFGIVADVPILKYYRVGIGASYAGSAVKQANNTGTNTTIGSTQGYAYGSATYGPLFLDAVLSAGINNYHGKKNITLLGQTATSAYTGFQYGAKFKTGFSIPWYQVELTPMGTLQYMNLNTSRYTEQGAGTLNQEVSSMHTNTIRAGFGGRIADRSQEEDFFPEIHALYIVDIRNPNVLITSRFIDGGGSFVSTGVLPPKSGVVVGGSITAMVTDNFMVNGSYDLEAKKSFRSHSATLKFKYLF